MIADLPQTPPIGAQVGDYLFQRFTIHVLVKGKFGDGKRVEMPIFRTESLQ